MANVNRKDEEKLSYKQSAAYIHKIRSVEKKYADNPDQTTFLTHGHKTEKVIVFFHGITNTPHQFLKLGELFYKAGYNVLIPLKPYHGNRNKMTPDLRLLKLKDVEKYIQAALNIAAGLGRNIYVLGLSAGGVEALAAARQFSIKKTVIVSPAVSIPVVPHFLNRPLLKLTGSLNFLYIWWVNPHNIFKTSIDAHPLPEGNRAYPRIYLSALTVFWRMGINFLETLKDKKLKAEKVVLITNENDTATSKTAASYLKTYLPLSTSRFKHYIFKKKLNLPHDIVDPTEPGGNIDYVYPILFKLVNE